MNRRFVDRLFVYGTLMTGEVRADLLGRATKVVSATTSGRLYHLRYGYPALIDVDDGEVEGELVVVPDLEDRLVELDDYEGELYRRVVRAVRTAEGITQAWCFVVDERAEAGLVADGALRVRGRWRPQDGA